MHLHRWHHFIGLETHFNSPPGGPNNFSSDRDRKGGGEIFMSMSN